MVARRYYGRARWPMSGGYCRRFAALDLRALIRDSCPPLRVNDGRLRRGGQRSRASGGACKAGSPCAPETSKRNTEFGSSVFLLSLYVSLFFIITFVFECNVKREIVSQPSRAAARCPFYNPCTVSRASNPRTRDAAYIQAERKKGALNLNDSTLH